MYTPYEKRARTGNKQHGSEVGKACCRYLFFRILPEIHFSTYVIDAKSLLYSSVYQ